MRQKFGLRKAFVMEIVPDNSKVAVADTVLQEFSPSTGPASYGAAETSNLGAQPPSSSLEPHAATPASSSQFYPPGSSYTADNMSLALAESSTAPVNFFSSLRVSSVNSCTSPADAQAATSMYPDSPCFGYVNPVYFTSHSVTAAGSSAFSGPFADASTAFQRCTTSFGPMQPDIPVYANSAFTSSESEPAISAAESPSQFAAQPLGTTAEVSPSLRAVAGYCQGAASVSALTSAVNENPSLLVVAEGDDDPTSLRVIDDTDDPTILRVADDLEDLSAGRTDVPLHSAEFSRTVVERRSQKCLTAEELPPLRISAGKISETEYQLPNVSGTYSLAYSGIERTSSLPSASPPSASTVRGEKRQREADVDEHTENPAKRSRKECRAGNLKCGMETGRSVLLGPVPALDCDICCVEPGFCRECTCILCCQTIVPDGGDCNLVRCLQRPSAGGICGHGAHLECALKSQMAGVVKERGLDMEYLCRRCDRKTDLRELVTRLLEAVGNTLYRSVAEKSLQLALQVMQGTEHGGDGARVLESLVQAALRKVQSGVDIQDVFNDLRDQGMAAEAAKQQCLGRASSNGEDVPQQPEASLDQWLPSSGSPSSHPSPGTPSSFSSPIIRRNSSVNSPADGTEGAETGDQTGVDGHADESGEAVKVPLRKISSPGIEPSNIKSSQIRVSSRRDRAGSSSSDINQEGTYDSQAMARNGKFDAHEPGSRSLNLRTRSDHRGPTVGAGVHKDEHCKSCGAKRPTTHGLEVTSTLKFLMGEDGGLKSHRLSPARKGEFTAQNRARHTYDTDKEADHGVTGSPGTFSAAVLSSEDRASRKVLGISLRLLDDKCQQQVQSVLQKLRQVQQAEFLRAQERLMAQKDHILKQYELLEISRNEFDAAEISSSHHIIDFDRLMLKLSNQLAKASEERQTFDKMLEVAEGFSALSKDDLRKHYGWPPAREVESHD